MGAAIQKRSTTRSNITNKKRAPNTRLTDKHSGAYGDLVGGNIGVFNSLL